MEALKPQVHAAIAHQLLRNNPTWESDEERQKYAEVLKALEQPDSTDQAAPVDSLTTMVCDRAGRWVPRSSAPVELLAKPERVKKKHPVLVSRMPNLLAPSMEIQEVAFEDLARELTTPGPIVSDKKAREGIVPAISPVLFSGGRSTEHAKLMGGIMLDDDSGLFAVSEHAKRVPFAMIVYGSGSNTDEHPRVRTYIPFLQLRPAKDFPRIFNHINNTYYEGRLDKAAAKVTQPFYLPNHLSEEHRRQFKTFVRSPDEAAYFDPALIPTKKQDTLDPVLNMVESEPTEDAPSLELVKEWLALVPCHDSERWHRIAKILWRRTAGSEEGFCIFHEYSKTQPKYVSERDCRRQWRNPGKRVDGITWKTLRYWAETEGGWARLQPKAVEQPQEEPGTASRQPSEHSSLRIRPAAMRGEATLEQGSGTAMDLPGYNRPKPEPEPVVVEEERVEEKVVEEVATEPEYASVAASAPTPAGKLLPRPARGTGIFKQAAPWPDPVDGAELLDALVASVTKYVVLPKYADVALAAWVMHTYVVDASPISPILALESPTPECGKTTTQDWLGQVVDRPLITSNVTPSSIFRLMHQEQPTLLLDEADTQLGGESQDLIGILNSGHRRSGALTLRTVRRADDTWGVETLSTWGAKSIACIKKLPPTLQSRSIVISLKRKLVSEMVERIEEADPAEFEVLRQKATRWADDNWQAVKAARPKMPSTLGNRAGDNWRELYRIGLVVGEKWPARIEAAALAMSGVKGTTTDNEELLKDIRKLFDASGAAAIHSADLIRELCLLEDRPWLTWNKVGMDKSITQIQVANLLDDFGISPGTVDIKKNGVVVSLKGYKLKQFEEVFTRYLK